jgi:hypothetical protein
MNSQDGASASEPSISDAPDLPLTTRLAASTTAAPALGYADFAAAVKNAMRDIHSPDLLARNPLLLHGVCNLGKPAGPQELRALLSETVSTLFANPRDEKLRQVLKLTYCQPGLKQEAVADRLSLSFGTYRRHLGTVRERLTRWLWEIHQNAQAQPELPSAEELTAKEEKRGGEIATSPEAGARAAPRRDFPL